ncbi:MULTISPECIES: GNAT family N-acetyltransferase [unclassified Ornithinimicrobium]|uniref:GNAT family N-acetyltransferase n=1 Tax=unclassified Ornithinimicrobium TaxID=2615080 RepID=UPI003852EE92
MSGAADAGQGVVVRPAGRDDHADVGRILVAAYAPSGMPPEQPYWRALRDTAARTRDAEVWVAELDGRVVGTVTWAGTGSDQREIAREGEAEFRMLGVAPDAQGRGVGAALLEAVMDRARADGYAAVVLCSATWMTTAHRLYQRRGFRRLPDRDWTPVPGVDLMAYGIPLRG